jgi:signal transduction histidine kinase
LLESQNVVLSFDSLADEDAVRLGSETGLPWALHIASADLATDLAQSNGRRRVMLGGLGILLLVVAAASYFIARVILRELTAARLQSDFVAAVSHEFRIPLTSMRQVTEILNDERVADPERVRSYHRTQARATDRLQRLVETLLDFGRMEAGAKPYRLQPLDLAAWLRGVVADFQAEAAASGHKIELDAQEVGMVDADSEALAHAMRNLLDNAVKYSPQSNTVWVELAALGDRCAIRVRDSGFGIPHDEQKHVFQKFFRGSAAKSNAIKGTGVGLAMVEHIVAAHHGSIELDSQPGKGSTFTVYLPLNVND